MDFDFKKFEKEAQEKWKKADAFKFNNDSKNPYYVLEQFPYPSGKSGSFDGTGSDPAKIQDIGTG